MSYVKKMKFTTRSSKDTGNIQRAIVSGTEDPGVNGIPFIPLQDIITTTNLDLVSTKLSGYLNEDNLKQLIINVRRNFTLMNIFVFRT